MKNQRPKLISYIVKNNIMKYTLVKKLKISSLIDIIINYKQQNKAAKIIQKTFKQFKKNNNNLKVKVNIDDKIIINKLENKLTDANYKIKEQKKELSKLNNELNNYKKLIYEIHQLNNDKLKSDKTYGLINKYSKHKLKQEVCRMSNNKFERQHHIYLENINKIKNIKIDFYE